MTVEEAQKTIISNRQQIKKLAQDNKKLTEWSTSKGAYVDPGKADRVKRNKAIIEARNQGDALSEIAKQFGMSPTVVMYIVNKNRRF